MPLPSSNHPGRTRIVLVPSLAALVLIGTGTAFAQTRQLDAHVHGESALAIAVDGSRVVMELDAPGMDIVGFERPATSDGDRAAVEAARETLADPVAVFGVPSAAGCEVVSQDVAFVTEAEHEHEHAERAEHEHEHEEGEHEHAEGRA